LKILLMSMPDATHPLFPRFCRPPNLGLASLAGNLREEADVAVADLILRRKNVPQAVREALETVQPDLVGLSAMTFQYYTATRIAELIRHEAPGLPILIGGYHASMAYQEIASQEGHLFDFICRNEGEHTFLELIRGLKRGDKELHHLAGLSWKKGDEFVHNEPRPVAPLERIAPPDRNSRLWSGYHIHGMPFDFAETSRGCTLPCRFCSITRMYGRNFRSFDRERILEDLEGARSQGTKEIFFVDDNITLQPGHMEDLCKSIIERGLHKEVGYSTQASVEGLHRNPSVIEDMAEAGFELVFLGIENVSKRNLKAYKKGDIVHSTQEVIRELQRNNIMVMGGFVLGAPEDDQEDILEQFEFMKNHPIDSYLVQILTPYPSTPMTSELEQGGYIVNKDLRRYSGLFANVCTDHLSSRQLDYLRWRHFPYYRSLRWMRRAVAPKIYPWGIFKESLMRLGQWLLEESRILFRSREHAFKKYMEANLRDNLFFGEEPVITWPDAEGHEDQQAS